MGSWACVSGSARDSLAVLKKLLLLLSALGLTELGLRVGHGAREYDHDGNRSNHDGFHHGEPPAQAIMMEVARRLRGYAHHKNNDTAHHGENKHNHAAHHSGHDSEHGHHHKGQHGKHDDNYHHGNRS